MRSNLYKLTATTTSKIRPPSTLLVSNFRFFPRRIDDTNLRAKIAYWSLLYEKIAIHIESISDIEALLDALGSDAFQMLSDSKRLLLLFDPQIVGNYRPAFS